ncbi:MAG: YidC/Oxa1 family membrane protein insertase [Vampirovibrio sp.]|nr:YidC/Oxa1 family membrane protein insertase [Vampirovibrio sp.]
MIIFDIINQAMLHLLSLLHDVTANYGLAIVVLTVLLRLAFWPLNTAQTRSMKKMQELQPKMKQIQERFKDNPQKMQEAMVKFYAENKFNPFAGCLPMIIQFPILICLYGALNSPEFVNMAVNAEKAGDGGFLFVERLYNTLQSHAGDPLDGTFNIKPDDKFQSAKDATILYKNGETLVHKVKDTGKVFKVSPQPLIPGDPVKLTLNMEELGLSQEHVQAAKHIELNVTNQNTRELEKVTFEPTGSDSLIQTIPSKAGENKIHFDVLYLILLYAVMTILYQRVMTPKKTGAAADDPQAKMMKLMPLLFVGIFFIIPIPAGVMLYILSTMVLMFAQTAYVNWTDGRNDSNVQKPSEQVVDIKPN